MKQLLLALFVLVGLTSHAKNYYLSASGDNANTGLSPATPWRTIAKINTFTFTAKDSILFKRGETFYVIERDTAAHFDLRHLSSNLASLRAYT